VEEDDQQSVSKPLNSAEKEDSCAGDKSIVGVLLGEVNGIGKSEYSYGAVPLS